ncbi:uncharacterized protein DUF1648 [Terracoccus luteus]|uniref:Uncharacterized protein DUF1648 n=1 Tax=Terracoccus luteus TaxID=53356 RepID=A0A495XZJ2_9MICO|nr:DUF1648 domain-containing protein [Terracoccus luteus]RKT78294.1 uncharacterized protein DUF1648 [Terracoccus luteus]
MRDRTTSSLVVGALAGPVLALVGVAVTASRSGRLPETVATHWGPGGEADGFMSRTSAVVVAALLTALLPQLLTVVAVVSHRTTRGLLAGVATGTAALLAVVGFGTLLAQQGQPAPGGDVSPGLFVAVGLVAGLASGLLVARLGQAPRDPADGSTSRPTDGPTLDVAPTARLAWTGRAGSAPALVAGVVALAAVPVVLVLGAGWVVVPLALVAPLALVTATAHVVVDQQGLRVTAVGLAWARVPLDEVASAGPGTVSALGDFGGWGWRHGRDGRTAWVTRSGPALVVQRVDAPDVLVTVERPDEAAAVLNTLAARRRTAHR